MWQWQANNVGLLVVKQGGDTQLQEDIIRGLRPVVAIIETPFVVLGPELVALRKIVEAKLAQRQDPPNMVRETGVFGANTIFFGKIDTHRWEY